MMKRIPIYLLVCVMIIFCSCTNNSSDGSAGDPQDSTGSGQNDSVQSHMALTLSQIETVTIDGETFTGYDFPENKLIVLNIWATWCPPCVEELPYLQEVSEYYSDKNVEIIGIMLDGVNEKLEMDSSVIDAGKKLLATAGANYTVILPDETLIKELVGQVHVIPTTFFMDGKGNVISGVVGSRNADEWKEEIDGALEKI